MKESGCYTCKLMRVTKLVSVCTSPSPSSSATNSQRNAPHEEDNRAQSAELMGIDHRIFFQVQVEAITGTVTTELNEKYNALQEQKRQT